MGLLCVVLLTFLKNACIEPSENIAFIALIRYNRLNTELFLEKGECLENRSVCDPGTSLSAREFHL